MAKEVEIKFRIASLPEISRALKRSGFKQVTRSTHEMNSLYDLPGQTLRKRGELLRLRKYGEKWVLTHKAKGKNAKQNTGRHKVRTELETRVENGHEMDAILRAMGFAPTFRYEKYRAEWSDGTGHVVLDKTPIGIFGELEGPSAWIDRTASALKISKQDYITQTYADLFFTWKRKTRLPVNEMTFHAIPAKYKMQ
jgi:adenylate cyclase class 2